MAGIANSETNVSLGDKLNRLLEIGSILHIHSILNIGANHALGVPGEEWIAALVGEKGRHDRGARIDVGLWETPIVLEPVALLLVV